LNTDVEEITLKAEISRSSTSFVKMLVSTPTKENESVFIDLLTAADLLVLKARKAGARLRDASDMKPTLGKH
jgi:hypothetical protein